MAVWKNCPCWWTRPRDKMIQNEHLYVTSIVAGASWKANKCGCWEEMHLRIIWTWKFRVPQNIHVTKGSDDKGKLDCCSQFWNMGVLIHWRNIAPIVPERSLDRYQWPQEKYKPKLSEDEGKLFESGILKGHNLLKKTWVPVRPDPVAEKCFTVVFCSNKFVSCPAVVVLSPNLDASMSHPCFHCMSTDVFALIHFSFSLKFGWGQKIPTDVKVCCPKVIPAIPVMSLFV